jgi:hypothetical protein
MALRSQSYILGIAFFTLGSLALGACSSSGSKCGPGGCTSGMAGGAAGTSGSGGGAAGATGGAAAGTSGDAAAGASGDAAAGAGGGSGGATADGGPSDASTCPFAPSLGAATVVQAMPPVPMATEGGDRSTMTVHDSVAYLGPLDNATRPNELDIQLYKNKAPFGAMLAPMSISLVGQDNFATCGACVILHPMYSDGVEIRAQTNYIATSGTLNVTAVPNGTTMQLTASLSNVTFKHVTIDSQFVTTKVDDCTITLTSVSIDTPVMLVTP